MRSGPRGVPSAAASLPVTSQRSFQPTSASPPATKASDGSRGAQAFPKLSAAGDGGSCQLSQLSDTLAPRQMSGSPQGLRMATSSISEPGKVYALCRALLIINKSTLAPAGGAPGHRVTSTPLPWLGNSALEVQQAAFCACRRGAPTYKPHLQARGAGRLGSLP